MFEFVAAGDAASGYKGPRSFDDQMSSLQFGWTISIVYSAAIANIREAQMLLSVIRQQGSPATLRAGNHFKFSGESFLDSLGC